MAQDTQIQTDGAKAASVRKGRRWEVVAAACAAVGGILMIVAFLLVFLVAPMVKGANLSDSQAVMINGTVVTTKLLFSQKIFYFHVAVAVVALVFVIAAAVYGILYLARKQARSDLRCKTCMELALVFILGVMLSGDMWTRHDWGVWWVWEPRLTTYFILTLLVIAYFILRAAIDDPERRARFSSVFAIIAAIDAPISYFITRLVPSSIHPVVFRTDSGLPPNMLVPFLLAMFGVGLFSFGLYRLRLCLAEQAVEVEDLKTRYEELRR